MAGAIAGTMTIEQAGKLALSSMQSGMNCAESVLRSVSAYFGKDGYTRLATPFGGGMGLQSVCGAVTGGLMAIGLLLGRDGNTQDRSRASACTKNFLEYFEDRFGALTCREMTGVDFRDPTANALFRQIGGDREKVCLPAVEEATKWLCTHMFD